MSRKSTRLLTRRKSRVSQDQDECGVVLKEQRKEVLLKDVVKVETVGKSQGGSRKRKAEEALGDLDPNMERVQKRRQHCLSQNQFVPIAPTEAGSTTTCVVIPSQQTPTPADVRHHSNGSISNSVILPAVAQCVEQVRTPGRAQPATPKHLITRGFRDRYSVPVPMRHSTLPALPWADHQEVWSVMLKKEQTYHRDENVLLRHPQLQPRMRAILLDWIIEVCEVYRLHRESFYLCVDYIDRYMSSTRSVAKHQLQLIGITALFIAAKIEEIYPPKLTEFAYVTDGACTENEILEQELVMLKALRWDLSPMTVNSWLNIFLQIVNMDQVDDSDNSNFVIPQYSTAAFIQIARLLDLCFLDVGCLQFSYSILATSALYHMSSEHVALTVSGYKWSDLAPCVQWLGPFALTLRELGPAELKTFNAISSDDAHNIQTHAVDLEIMEKSQQRRNVMLRSVRTSPDLKKDFPSTLITPPSMEKGKSVKKQQQAAVAAAAVIH